MKTVKDKAILFIGFRHKKDSIKTAADAGYKTILLTRKLVKEAKKLFDEIIEDDILQTEVIDKIIPKLKEKYTIKGIISNYEHYVVVRSYLAERFSVPSSSVYAAACTRNKAMQRHALKYMKENIKHQTVKTESQALSAFKKLGDDVFVKSIAGIKGRLIFHVDSEKKLHKVFKQLKSVTKDLDEDLYNDYSYCNFNFEYPDPNTNLLVEKAEYGEQISVSSLVSNYTIWHAPSICDIYTAAHLGREDSFLAFRILPSKQPEEIVEKAKKATETAAKILGLRYCPIFCDLIVKKNGDIKIIEIASRMGGYRPQMYEKAYDLKINQLLVESVIGKKITVNKKPKNHVSMIEIFPKKEGKFKEIKNIDLLKKDKKAHYIEILPKKGDKVGFAKLNFTPVLRFLLTADSYEEAYSKSIEYQKNLEVIVE